MKVKVVFIGISFLTICSCVDSTKTITHFTTTTTKIAFGSCGHEDQPLPIFNKIRDHNPDLFIFLGDNIYGDTRSMDTLRAKYQLLGKKESFKNFKKSSSDYCNLG